MMSTTFDLESLYFKEALSKAIGGVSATQVHRLRKARVIPDPDAFVGSRPAWTGRTIMAVIDTMKGTKPPEKTMPRSPGRPRKNVEA
jgi:hypothetical protein